VALSRSDRKAGPIILRAFKTIEAQQHKEQAASACVSLTPGFYDAPKSDLNGPPSRLSAFTKPLKDGLNATISPCPFSCHVVTAPVFCKRNPFTVAPAWFRCCPCVVRPLGCGSHDRLAIMPSAGSGPQVKKPRISTMRCTSGFVLIAGFDRLLHSCCFALPTFSQSHDAGCPGAISFYRASRRILIIKSFTALAIMAQASAQTLVAIGGMAATLVGGAAP